jgi:hypothetical protein
MLLTDQIYRITKFNLIKYGLLRLIGYTLVNVDAGYLTLFILPADAN